MDSQLEQTRAESGAAAGSRPSRRSRRTHEAILGAAGELLHENGYLNVTIEAIAARAGAGKQTIYRWWPSKAHLYMELYSVLANRDIHLPDTGAVESDLRDLFYQLFDLFDRTAAGPALVGLIAEAQSNQGLARLLFTELVTRRRRLWRELLQRGVDRGEVREDVNLEMIVDVLSGPVWYRMLLGHAPLDAAFADDFVRTLLRGVQTAGGTAGEPPVSIRPVPTAARAKRDR